MKANETSFQPIIEGTKQYVVPLFQRPYSWTKKEWDVLWEDLLDLCENPDIKSHFIGSLVTMPTESVPEGVTKYMLIDGQQRLTTIFVILAAIRDVAQKNNMEELAQEISATMLVNPFKKGIDYLKLMPTQVDRTPFKDLIGNSLEGEGQLAQSYQFFERKIRNQKVDLNTLKNVITTRLSVVSIVLDRDDNPHLVFESLNAKGRALTQADLIRNYFFMRIRVDQQDEIHDRYWLPMQTALGDSLTESIRHYLMRSGSIIKESEVYFILKERLAGEDAIRALQDISRFAGYYEKLLSPEKEANLTLRIALKRINRLDVTTVYPFLLNCYHDYCTGCLPLADYLDVLGIIENFIVRRFVCSSLKDLNKNFPYLYGKAKAIAPENLPQGVRSALQSQNYPRDTEFRSRLLDSRLYGNGSRKTMTKLFLETLELSYGHHEQVPFDNLTIEHVMPQTMDDDWRRSLGEDWAADHELFLHTLGNLTLTGYNSELSNDSFPIKKSHFATSHIGLNHYFKDITVWDRDAIETRAEVLAQQVLTVWPYFGEDQSKYALPSDTSGKKPKALTILECTMPVTNWRDVLEQTMNTLSGIDPDTFDEFVADHPRLMSKDPNAFRVSRLLNSGYYIEMNFSSKSICRYCMMAIEWFGLSGQDWDIEAE